MRAPLLILLLSWLTTGHAQTFEISGYSPTDTVFLYLLEPNSVISQNDSINELVIDLVEPTLLDSVIEKKKQRHKIGPIGWFINIFGFNWRAFSMQKEKLVGTVVRQMRSREERYTEYDINFDLNFHLDKYLNRALEMYDKQGEIARQDIRKGHETDYDTVPFIRDTANIDIRDYWVHCELTPESDFRDTLHHIFYPTLHDGGNLGTHPNFETNTPTVGFYGTLCLDCNHNCKTELHPYEWMWWLKCTDADTSRVKEWNIGLFHEGSNRMKKWSVNPMIGTVRLPFAFSVNDSPTIEIEHGATNTFDENGLADLDCPANSFDASQQTRAITITGNEVEWNIEVNWSYPITTDGLRYWLDGLNYDPDRGVLSGYLYYAASAIDLYTCKITFQ